MKNAKNALNPLEIGELAENILLLIRLHRENKLHERVVRQVIKGACWWVSNKQGKKDKCALWSKAARQIRIEREVWDAQLGLIHEHLVPRNVIEEQIMNLNLPTADAVGFLLALSTVCVVTKEEDEALRKDGLRNNMTAQWKPGDDLFARYKAVGIALEPRTAIGD